MTISEHRFERKFLISMLRTYEIEHHVKLHPALFSEVFSPRHVNNIYLDSHHLENYWDNVCGSGQRLKVRVRWYGEAFGEIAKPVLELKIKSGFTNLKESYPMASFSLVPGFTFAILSDAFDRSELPGRLRERLRALEPTLLNRYRRKYFLSADRLFRATIDNKLSYTQIAKTGNQFTHTLSDHIRTILELKYATDCDNQAGSISGLFPFRITKSSKYVSGIDWINKGCC